VSDTVHDTPTTPATLPPLDFPTILALATLFEWLAEGARVDRADGDDLVSGTLRHLVTSPDDYAFPRASQDIRTAYVRVTLTGGMDTVWSVTEVAELIKAYLIGKHR
jgi:hypothetical protein